MSCKVNVKQLEELFCKIAGINFDLRAKGDSSDMFPVLILGEKGVGKTSLIPEFAKRLSQERGEKVHVTTLYLSTQEPADLLGMPMDVTEKGKHRTVYARPEWLPDEDSQDCHVIVCDEYNRAPIYVQQPMLPFSIQGRLHTHNLPKKSIVVFLCNPASEDYVVTPFNDSAFYDRMARFNFGPEKMEWIKHAERSGVAESVIETANKMNDMLKCGHVKDEYDVKVTPSNRTFTKLGILMTHAGPEWLGTNGEALATAYVGAEFATAIMKQFRKLLDSIPSPESILKEVEKHDKWLKKNSQKEYYEAGKFGEINNGLQRLISKNLEALVKDKESVTNLGVYMSYVADDQVLEFFTTLMSQLQKDYPNSDMPANFAAALDKHSKGAIFERLVAAPEKKKKEKAKEK